MLLRCLPVSAQAGGPIPGEVARYEAFYHWGFIWVSAAQVEFRVDTVAGDSQLLRLRSVGASWPSYDWFFPVRDTFDSWVDRRTVLPVRSRISTLEGSHRKQFEAHFAPAGSISYTVADNQQGDSRGTLFSDGGVRDVMSAVYACRRLDFDRMEPGHVEPIPTVMDDSVYALYIRYQGRDTIALRGSDQRHPSHRIKAKLIEGTIFREGEDLTVWITDDRRRLPLVVEAKILIGSVKAFLVSAQAPAPGYSKAP